MESETIIKLENVSAVQRKKVVLNGVNLSIGKGEFVYIIGKTGSGKSSLLKLLYRELTIKSGDASILDFNLSKIKSRQIPALRKALGIVFQDFQLLPDRSIEENLWFVMEATGWKDKKAMRQQSAEILQQVGLGGIGHKMPHELSGGEQQRVVIARAMVNSPKVILADEPTGNLDPDSSVEIMNILTQIAQTGTTVVMATHDMDIVRKYPSRTLVCKEGILTEENHE